MSEVAVTENLTIEGTTENPKKRTLDVNSFDVQVASNTAGAGNGYSDGFTLKTGGSPLQTTATPPVRKWPSATMQSSLLMKAES